MFRFLGLIRREALVAISKPTGVQSFTAFLQAIIGVINIPDIPHSVKRISARPTIFPLIFIKTNLDWGSFKWELFSLSYFIYLPGWFFLPNEEVCPNQQFITICRLKVKNVFKMTKITDLLQTNISLHSNCFALCLTSEVVRTLVQCST